MSVPLHLIITLLIKFAGLVLFNFKSLSLLLLSIEMLWNRFNIFLIELGELSFWLLKVHLKWSSFQSIMHIGDVWNIFSIIFWFCSSMYILFVNVSIRIRKKHGRSIDLLEQYKVDHPNPKKQQTKRQYYLDNIEKFRQYSKNHYLLKNTRINIFKKNIPWNI